MLLFAFFRVFFSIHCHSADEEEVPVPSKPPMAQGQNNKEEGAQAKKLVTCGTRGPLGRGQSVPFSAQGAYCSAPEPSKALTGQELLAKIFFVLIMPYLATVKEERTRAQPRWWNAECS